MTRSEIVIGVVTAVTLTVVSGVMYGRASYRWGTPVDTLHAVAQLEAIPTQFGDWEQASSQEMDKEVEAVLECMGYIVRSYVHRVTGDRVNMFMLLGPPGPTAAHTPDICYSSQDFSIVQKKDKWLFEDSSLEHVFWAQTLEPVDVKGGNYLRVYHAWSVGREWQAAKGRFSYGAERYLYKVQVAAPLLNLDEAGTEKDLGRDFLEQFVPAVQRFLVPPDKS